MEELTRTDRNRHRPPRRSRRIFCHMCDFDDRGAIGPALVARRGLSGGGCADIGQDRPPYIFGWPFPGVRDKPPKPSRICASSATHCATDSARVRDRLYGFVRDTPSRTRNQHDPAPWWRATRRITCAPPSIRTSVPVTKTTQAAQHGAATADGSAKDRPVRQRQAGATRANNRKSASAGRPTDALPDRRCRRSSPTRWTRAAPS